MFETADGNGYSGAYIHEKFLHRGFASPKRLPPDAVFLLGCLLPAYSSNGTIVGDRKHFVG